MSFSILRAISEYGLKIGAPSALCIGNFDGVHAGHRRLIGRLIEEAGARGLSPTVLTFEPHPLDVLHPGRSPGRLTTPGAKARLLEGIGVDTVVVHPFTGSFASLGPEEFIDEVIVAGLRARVVVAGPDFRFGFGGAGDRNLLETYGKRSGVGVISVEHYLSGGKIVSSSRVRSLLAAEGNVSEAMEILGRPYGVEGMVVRGMGRGKGMGFPTANLSGIGVLVPREGVYAAAGIIDGEPLPAALHIGERKTFDEPFSIEAFFIGPGIGQALYGRKVRVFFLRRLRDVERFESREKLREKINEDVERVIAIHAEMRVYLGGAIWEC